MDGTGGDIKEWTYSVSKDLDGGGSTTIIAPDKTRTVSVKYGAGPKTAATTGSGGQSVVMIYPFGFRDARAGMTVYKKFFSSSEDGWGGELLRYEMQPIRSNHSKLFDWLHARHNGDLENVSAQPDTAINENDGDYI